MDDYKPDDHRFTLRYNSFEISFSTDSFNYRLTVIMLSVILIVFIYVKLGNKPQTVVALPVITGLSVVTLGSTPIAAVMAATCGVAGAIKIYSRR